MRSMLKINSFLLLLAVGLIPLTASADCFITGHSTAELNTEYPELGTWKYTIELNWDSGDNHGLSHIDLLLGFAGHSCECDEFAFGFAEPAGLSNGWGEDDRDDDEEPCDVYYEGEFECHGDPSLPNVEEPIIKFEPDEEDCEPGPIGSGVFVFYSNWEPEPVDTPNEWLVFKAAGNKCSGPLTGELPVLGCETVAATPASWSNLKTLY